MTASSGIPGGVRVATTVAVVATDVACLLRRFALQQSFSADTGGGGRDSNARLLPALLQLGRHLLASASADAAAPLAAVVAELAAGTAPRDDKVCSS